MSPVHRDASRAGKLRRMILIRTDNSYDELDAGPTDRIAELLKVDSIDVVRLPNDIDLWIDDEGMINGSELAVLATLVLERLSAQELRQALYGDVLLARVNDEGDTVGLTEAQRSAVHDAITWGMQVMRSPDPDRG